MFAFDGRRQTGKDTEYWVPAIAGTTVDVSEEGPFLAGEQQHQPILQCPGTKNANNMKYVYTLVVFIAICAITVAAWRENIAVEVRYSVDVEVVVDGVTGHGRGVWQAKFWVNSYFAPTGGVSALVEGEAIPIVMESGEKLFMLRRLDTAPTGYVYGEYIRGCIESSGNLDLVEKLSNFKGSCIIDYERPLIVEVILEKRSALINGLMRVGRRCVVCSADRTIESTKITVEVTREPLSSGLVAENPWIKTLPSAENFLRHGRRPNEETIYQEDFLAKRL